MYSLLTEEERTITITGNVTDENNTPVSNAKIQFSKSNKVLGGTFSNEDGVFSTTLKLDNGTIDIVCSTGGKYLQSQKTIEVITNKNDYDLNFLLIKEKTVGQEEVKVIPKYNKISGKIYNSEGDPLLGVTITLISDFETKNIAQNKDGSYTYSTTPVNKLTLIFKKEGYNKIKKTFNFDEQPSQTYDVKLKKFIDPCENFKSTETTFYGKFSSKDYNVKQKQSHDSIVINAKKNALKQYLEKYPPNDIEDYEPLYKKIESEGSIDYKIVCEKYEISSEDELTKYVSVEISKTSFDTFINPKRPSQENKKVRSEKIEFRNIPFFDLIKLSIKENKPAFILFSNEDETISVDLKNRLNNNRTYVDTINNNYIPVEYINDENDELGNVLASDSLDVTKIPSVVIVTGEGDEVPKMLEGSYRVIKKVSNFGSYFSRPDEYLNTIKNLLK
jgi:hypothetical protein